jgi:PAS domain S-box-containing protein
MDKPKKIRVLVAEDEFLIQEFLREIFTELGFELLAIASDGKQAFEKTLSLRPDVIVMDISMPEMDGFEASRLIQQHCPTPIVILSAYESKKILNQAIEAGAAAYLSKPPEAKDIERAIHIAIARHQDLQDLKNARDELEKSKNSYHSLTDALPDIIFRFDAQFRHIFANQAVEKILPFKAADFLGKTHREMKFPEENCSYWEKCIQAVFNEKKIKEEEFSLFFENQEIIFNWRLLPEFDAKNHVKSVLTIARDVTKQRKIETDYRNLFEKMLEGFAVHEIICDSSNKPVDYRFISVNPAFEKLTGLSASDIIGKTVLQVIPKIEKYWIEIYGEVALTGINKEFINYSQELGKYYEVIAFQPKHKQFACIFRDITERINQEEEKSSQIRKLQQKQQVDVPGVLTGEILHGIINSLSIIRGYAELSLEQDTTMESLKQHMQRILQSTDRAQEKINKILP